MEKNYEPIKLPLVECERMEQLLKEHSSNFEEYISAYYILDELISELKICQEKIKTNIQQAPLEFIKEDLINRGLLTISGEPEFVKEGKFKVRLSEKKERNFSVDTSEFPLLGSIVDKYKNEPTYSKEKIKKDYDNEILAEEIKPYVSENPELLTKMTKYTIKEEK